MTTRFSQKASSYNSASTIQKQAAKALVEKLTPLELKPCTAADLGTGTGHLAKLLLEQFPVLNLDCCDISTKMLEVLSKELGHFQRISTHQSSLPPKPQYDLISSNFSLQWFPELNKTINHCIKSLSPTGVISFSIPVDGTFAHLKEAAENAKVEIQLPLLPQAEAILKTFPTSGKMTSETIELEESFDNTLAFLRGLHKIGAVNNEPTTPTKALRKLIKHHDELFNGRVIAKYKVLQIIYKRQA